VNDQREIMQLKQQLGQTDEESEFYIQELKQVKAKTWEYMSEARQVLIGERNDQFDFSMEPREALK